MTETKTRTCRTFGPGAMYFHKRRGEHASVSSNHIVLACDACEYVVSLSTRVYSPMEIDTIRRQHLSKVHFAALQSGAMSYQE